MPRIGPSFDCFKMNIWRREINHKTLPHFHFNENIISFQGGISKLYIRHFAWANGRVAVAGVHGGRRRVERRHPAGPPPPRGIDTSFELVAMETANGAGRRRGFGVPPRWCMGLSLQTPRFYFFLVSVRIWSIYNTIVCSSNAIFSISIDFSRKIYVKILYTKLLFIIHTFVHVWQIFSLK